MKFILNKKYYTGEVYEWNLPTGWSCPYAKECLVKVDRNTGKFENKSDQYRCYAASPERFPAVREHRWRNYEYVKNGGIPVLPKECHHVRIHSAGDFFSQPYFDMWVKLTKNNPNVKFWAYTKSLRFWVKRLGDIPDNFLLTASFGGVDDNLIIKHSLRYAKVVKDKNETDLPIDYNDDYARVPNINFALLDNNITKRKRKESK